MPRKGNISFDDLVERMDVAMGSMSGEELATLYNANFGEGMEYVGDSLFKQAKAPKKSKKAETVSILPTFSPEQGAEINKLIDEKQNLEYLGIMMLKRLEDQCSIEQLLKIAIKHERADADNLVEFFGDRDKDEEAGCDAAEGHTIPSLIKAWQETTEKMLRAVSGK